MVYILMHLLNLLLREAFNDPEFSQEFVKNKIVLLMKLYAVEPIQSLLKTTEAALPAMISVMKTRDDLDIVCAHSFFYGDEAEFRQKREDYRKSVLVQSFHIERMEESVACLNFLFSLSVGTKSAVFPKPDMDEFIATRLNNLLLSDWIRDESLLMTIFQKKPLNTIDILQSFDSTHKNYASAQAFLESKTVFDFRFTKMHDLETLVRSPHFLDAHVIPVFLYVVNHDLDASFFRFHEQVSGHPVVKLLRNPESLSDAEKLTIESRLPVDSCHPKTIAYVATHAKISSFVERHKHNKELIDVKVALENVTVTNRQLSSLYEKYQHNTAAAELILKRALSSGIHDNSFEYFTSSGLVTAIINCKSAQKQLFCSNALEALLMRSDILTSELIMAVLTNVRLIIRKPVALVVQSVVDALINNSALNYSTCINLLGKTVDPNIVLSTTAFTFRLGLPVYSTESHLYAVFKKYFVSPASFHNKKVAYDELQQSQKQALMKAFLPHIDRGVNFLQELKRYPEYAILTAITKNVALQKLINDEVSPSRYRELVYNARDIIPPLVATATPTPTPVVNAVAPSGHANLEVVQAILNKQDGKRCDVNFLVWVMPYVAHDTATLDLIAKHPANKNDTTNRVVTALSRLAVVQPPKPVDNPQSGILSDAPPVRFLARSLVAKPLALKETLKPAPNYSEFQGNPSVYMAKIKSYLIEQMNEYINRRTDKTTGDSTAIHASLFGKEGNEIITGKKVAEAKALLAEIRGANDIPACKAALEKSIQANKDIISWTSYRQGDFKMVLGHCVAQCDELMKPRTAPKLRAPGLRGR